MPKRKRTSSRGKSAYFKRIKFRRKRRRIGTLIPRISYSQGPLPHRLRCVHRYYSKVLLNATSGAVDDHAFAANDLYDPDRTGTGHQPYGFDQMAALYDHFVVIGSSCKVVAGGTGDHRFGIFVADNSTVMTDLTAWGEMGTAQSKRLPLAGGQVRTVMKKICPQRFLGVSRTEYMDDQFKGSNSASPSEQAFFHVGAWKADAGDPGQVTVEVFLTYIAIWIEPKRVSTS